MRSWIPLLLVAVAAACGPAQTEECRKYVACRKGYDVAAGNQPADLAHWEADGDCWVDSDAAAQCTEDCREKIVEVQDAVTAGDYDVPACK